MSTLTKEHITDTVNKVTTDIQKDIGELLVRNMKEYNNKANDYDVPGAKEYSFYISVMNTAIQASVTIMEQTLCQLLSEDDSNLPK